MCCRKLLKASCCVLFIFLLQFNTETTLFQHIIKMPRLNKSQRSETVGTLRPILCKDVAAYFNVDRKTIERLKIKFNRCGVLADLIMFGAPQKTNAEEDGKIFKKY